MTHTQTLQNPNLDIRPLNTWKSILIFSLPALLMMLSYHGFRRILLNNGVSAFDAMATSAIVPMAIIFVLPLVGFELEKRENPELKLLERFRYNTFSWKYPLYGLLGFIAINIGYGIFMQINLVLIDAGMISYPSDIDPVFDPTYVFNTSLFEQYLGSPLYHNWKLLTLYTLIIFFNIVGEELWWRGYVLPRQEEHYGRYTWIIHGIVWNLFHVFQWWNLIPLLPVTLIISYIAQKRQENWTPFIMHLLMNGMFLLVLLPHIFL